MATTQLLLARRATPADAELLHRMLSSTQRMARMIDQLLDFTRVRAGGGMPSDPRSFDLTIVIGDVLGEIRISHPRSELVFEQRGSLVGTWDADRLAQLVSNLVSNAVQHGTPNTPVSILADGSHAEQVTLRVSNEGAIPEALAPVVFEPFRGTDYQRDRAAGLGLGLYIAQQIAMVHRGTIELVASDPRRTTFLVTLPRTTSEPSHDD
jgi:signal transduction histidine kinase